MMLFVLLAVPCYAATVTLSIPSLIVSPGDQDVRVPVNISDVTNLGIITAQMIVHYDADVVVATSVEEGGVLPDGTNLTVDIENPNGRVQVTFAGTKHLAGEGALFYVLMDVVSDDSSACTTLSLSNVDLNEPGDFNIVTVDGDVALPVVLATFQATMRINNVVLSWHTALEVSNLGFHVYRREDESGPYTRINGKLIPGNAPSHDYCFVDADVVLGHTYHYLLESLDMFGISARLHTVQITASTERFRTLPITWAQLKCSVGR